MSGKWSSNSSAEDYIPRVFPAEAKPDPPKHIPPPHPNPPILESSRSQPSVPLSKQNPTIEDARGLFDMSRLASMDENMFEALTGVTKASFRSFFGGTRDRFDTNKVSLLHRLLLFFVKMKMGLDFSTLANLITKGYRWYKSEYFSILI